MKNGKLIDDAMHGYLDIQAQGKAIKIAWLMETIETKEKPVIHPEMGINRIQCGIPRFALLKRS